MKHNFEKTPLWEKLVGFCGFVLICFTVVYLVWAALTNTDQPPSIDFNVVRTEVVQNQHMVLVEVKNNGDRTVSELQLEARLTDPSGKLQRSVSQVNYLATQSTQRVGFYFTSDPTKGELTFITMGYQEP